MCKTTNVASPGAVLGEGRQVGQEVAAVERRRVGPGDPHGGAQVLQPFCVLWPDQRLQPHALRGVVQIDRRQVEAGAPGHARQGAGQRRCRTGARGKHQRLGRGRRDVVGAVGVAVVVGQQAQAGGGADFEQGQRLRQVGEDREQHGAAGRLVGLGTARQHNRADRFVVRLKRGAGLRPVGRCAADVAQRAEQQVRLLLIVR